MMITIRARRLQPSASTLTGTARILCAIAALLLLTLITTADAFAVPAYTVISLGTLGGTMPTSQAYGINDNGLVVGTAYTSGGQQHAFTYTRGRDA